MLIPFIPDGGGTSFYGYYLEGSKNVACYWKDGVRQRLDLSSISGDCFVNHVYIDGGSFIISGGYNVGYRSISCYWEDGVWQSLDYSGLLESVLTTNPRKYFGSVYCGGAYRNGSNYGVCYWKDGVRYDFPAQEDSADFFANPYVVFD